MMSSSTESSRATGKRGRFESRVVVSTVESERRPHGGPSGGSKLIAADHLSPGARDQLPHHLGSDVFLQKVHGAVGEREIGASGVMAEDSLQVDAGLDF